MRRLPLALAALALVATIGTARAWVGVDDPPHQRAYWDFKFILEEDGTIIDSVRFPWATDGQGWDFGDREAYSCGFAEYLVDGEVVGRIEFNRAIVDGDGGYIRVNDKFGSPEDSDTGGIHPFDCGEEGHSAVTWDGTDHVPHGTQFDFSLNGVPLDTLNLDRPPCAQGYWVPGNEPGEAWLWWDEDGTRDGDCTGGPQLPEPVARAYVPPQYMAPGFGVCVRDDLDGDRCIGIPPVETGPTGPTGPTATGPSPTDSPSPTETPSPTEACESKPFFVGTTWEQTVTVCHPL